MHHYPLGKYDFLHLPHNNATPLLVHNYKTLAKHLTTVERALQTFHFRFQIWKSARHQFGTIKVQIVRQHIL